MKKLFITLSILLSIVNNISADSTKEFSSDIADSFSYYEKALLYHDMNQFERTKADLKLSSRLQKDFSLFTATYHDIPISIKDKIHTVQDSFDKADKLSLEILDQLSSNYLDTKIVKQRNKAFIHALYQLQRLIALL